MRLRAEGVGLGKGVVGGEAGGQEIRATARVKGWE